MKIVCDSCSTKYSISDDKVRGKVFKIRCKKCSHIIVVKGTTEAAAAVPEAPSDAVWHLVVDGDQVGPLTDADVRARLSRNEISGENYVWKEGFSDWLRLADVPEFADVVSAAAPVGGELFSDSGGAGAVESGPRGADIGGFFGAGAAGQEAARAAGTGSLSGRTRAAPEEDAFSAPLGSSAGAEGADLFGAVAPVAARADSGRVRGRGANGTAPGGRHDGGRVESLTAQRSENSVLFSLSNLQSLAAPAAAAKPASVSTTEGSGLIDIRAMAASTMKGPVAGGMPLFGSDSKSAEDDLPTFGAFSSAAPVLLAFPSSSGPPKWIYVLIALVAVMIIAAGVAAFSILAKPVIVEQPAPPPVAPAPVAAAPAKAGGPAEEGAGAGSKPLAEGELPPRDSAAGATADKAAEKSPSDKGGGKSKKGKPKKGGGGDAKTAGGTAVASAAPATPSEPEKAKPVKGSLDDLLEGALNGRKVKPRVDEDPSAGKKPEAGGGGGGGALAKGAVVAGMNGVKPKVAACYAQFKQPGLAMVNVVIAKTGKVSGATVTGKFAGTPTGTCVENAVKSASFPPSDGLSTPYPFTLR